MVCDALTNAVNRSKQAKCIRMRQFIDEHKNSLHLHIKQLRHFALSPGGLVLDEIRAVVWPVLASCLISDVCYDQDAGSINSDSDFESALSNFAVSDDEIFLDSMSTVLGKPAIEDLKSHKEWNQVEMDVHRTLARFPPNISEQRRVSLQFELTPMIVRILWSCPRFKYYQGFHDVCLTLLLVLGSESAEHVGNILASKGIFNGYLTKTLEDTVLRDLGLMYVLLWKVDEELEQVMRSVELGSLFALSWPLTWFSHALHQYSQVVVCFDLFLASHPLMPVFLSSAVVLWRSSAVLAVSNDMAIMHHTLNKLPNEMPISALIADAQDLFRMFSPAELRGPLFDEYRLLIHATKTRQPSLPNNSLRTFLVAGTATAAFYILSKYLFM